MKNGLTMSVAKYRDFLNAFEKYGFPKRDVLKLAGVNPFILDSPDNRLTTDEANRIIREIVRLTNNEDIGLYPGEAFPKGFSNILGYLLMNCHTLREAIEKYSKYERIVDEAVISELRITGALAVFSVTIIDSALINNRQYIDTNISGTFAYIKLLTHTNFTLKEVHFTYPKPKDISRHQGIFQCPCFFDSSKNALLFDSQQLNLPILEPNQGLLLMFEKKAQEMLATLETKTIYTKKVISIIFKEINDHIPAIEEVAEKMDLGVRSLQKYLQNEGTSYTKLLNEIRMKVAVNYLRNDLSIDEVAYLLGFSDKSAFYKAFKKWTHLTPGEVRTRDVLNFESE